MDEPERIVQVVTVPLLQVLIIAGTVIGVALVANWRDTVEASRQIVANAAKIVELERRVGAQERRSCDAGNR